MCNPDRAAFEFLFDSGIQEIATGEYELILGVHDKNLSRTIFAEKMCSIKFENELDKNNYDADIMQLNNKIKFNLCN